MTDYTSLHPALALVAYVYALADAPPSAIVESPPWARADKARGLDAQTAYTESCMSVPRPLPSVRVRVPWPGVGGPSRSHCTMHTTHTQHSLTLLRIHLVLLLASLV